MKRDDAMQMFLDTAFASFTEAASSSQSQRSIRQVRSALETPAAAQPRPGRRLPVCAHLDDALATAASHPSLSALVDRFRAIEPLLEWSRRPKKNETASDNFDDGHANAMIVGPGGHEDRKDVWLGVSLLAPNVRYPDHDHAPEETYLVLSEGEFRQGDGPWFSPGIGGSFYNVPGIRHAMRSGAAPLFAFWMLRDQGDAA